MIDDKVLLLKTDCCGKEKPLRSASGSGMKGRSDQLADPE